MVILGCWLKSASNSRKSRRDGLPVLRALRRLPHLHPDLLASALHRNNIIIISNFRDAGSPFLPHAGHLLLPPRQPQLHHSRPWMQLPQDLLVVPRPVRQPVLLAHPTPYPNFIASSPLYTSALNAVSSMPLRCARTCPMNSSCVRTTRGCISASTSTRFSCSGLISTEDNFLALAQETTRSTPAARPPASTTPSACARPTTARSRRCSPQSSWPARTLACLR